MKDEIARVGAKGVYVVGGKSRLPDSILTELRSINPSITVERVAGATRTGTSIAVMTKAKQLLGLNFPHTAMIAYGYNYPDALALSPLAWRDRVPILLTHKEYLDPDVAGALSANGFTDIIIAGSTNAVSSAVDSALTNQVAIPTNHILRLGGSSRYETAKLIASWSCDLTGPGVRFDGSIGTTGSATALAQLPNRWYNGFATGENYADALAAGAFCGKAGAPLLLTTKSSATPWLFGSGAQIPAGKTSWIMDMSAIPFSTPIRRSYLFGSSSAIADGTFAAIDAQTGLAH